MTCVRRPQYTAAFFYFFFQKKRDCCRISLPYQISKISNGLKSVFYGEKKSLVKYDFIFQNWLLLHHKKRCGSSAWLEYMPVTHGVASSSLVRTAKKGRNIPPFFCAKQKKRRNDLWTVPPFVERRCVLNYASVAAALGSMANSPL